MTTPSVFPGGRPIGKMSSAATCVHPNKFIAKASTNESRQRFSNLILEHGEIHLQDWATVASSSPSSTQISLSPSKSSRQQMPGRSVKAPVRADRTSLRGDYRVDFDCSSASPTNAPPSMSMGRIEGRLRLCSSSIVFEPDDWTRGIIRCPFSKMEGPPVSVNDPVHNGSVEGVNGSRGEAIVFKCSRHVVMKANNIIGPFESIESVAVFKFTFVHSDTAQFLDVATVSVS